MAGLLALGRVRDKEPGAMEGHLVANSDEGGIMRCSRWFARSTAWRFL